MCFKLTYTPHSVDVVLRAVWEGHVDHKRQASNVDASGSHVSADQEANVTILECLWSQVDL